MRATSERFFDSTKKGMYPPFLILGTIKYIVPLLVSKRRTRYPWRSLFRSDFSAQSLLFTSAYISSSQSHFSIDCMGSSSDINFNSIFSKDTADFRKVINFHSVLVFSLLTFSEF
jgi:hypothetical protein